MRPVTPAMFMRLPARMKNGTARSGKLSTPAIMRCARVTSGVMPVMRIYNSDEVAIASATGSPSSIRMRNAPSRSSIALPFRTVECAGALQDRIAAPPVLDRDLHTAREHQDEAEQHGVIDKALGKLDRGHALVGDDLDEDPDQLDRVAEEGDPDQVDRGRQHPPGPIRQIAIDQVDLDVPRQAHAHRGPQKYHADQAVGRDLLGPGVAVVEDIAREELQKDAQRHDPEDRQRQPVLGRILAEIGGLGRLLLEGMGDLVRRDGLVDFSRRHVVSFKKPGVETAAWLSLPPPTSRGGGAKALGHFTAWMRSQSDLR